MIEIQACLICRPRPPAPDHAFPTHRYVRCPECGFVWQSPVKTPAELGAHYGRSYCEYERKNAAGFLHLTQLGLRDIGFFAGLVPPLPGKTLLDIGCATGALVHYFHTLG